MSMLAAAYAGKSVLLTGHTGFTGGWLALLLEGLGARVTGYALPPPTRPSLFETAGIDSLCRHVLGDVRDPAHLRAVVDETKPDYVFHLAAQALVRRSYEAPIETLETNVMGTAHLLDALRLAGRRCAVVVITSDKCYENREWTFGYRENDPLGGHDVYSASKGAAEIVVASFRSSFFHDGSPVAVASARAGNVIGGGDWADGRLLPDAMRALAKGEPVLVRNPDSIRPWQHVLEPLRGYLLLGARLSSDESTGFREAWNFGPRGDDAIPVRRLIDKVIAAWGGGSWRDVHDPSTPHEAAILRLATEKACARLEWAPRWGIDEALARTVEWYRTYQAGAGPHGVAALMRRQIQAHSERQAAER